MNGGTAIYRFIIIRQLLIYRFDKNGLKWGSLAVGNHRGKKLIRGT